MYWRLNRLQYPVYNLGPGKRLAVWVQGCSLGCAGCINPELWPAAGGKNIQPEQLAIGLLPAVHQLNGITITGGEPFEQYEPLIAFCTLIKQKINTNILVFSGYTLHELMEAHPDKLFLQCIDYLVDGRYIEGHSEKYTLKGSPNQKIYTFENGKIMEIKTLTNSKKWSFAANCEKTIFMAGIPGEGEMQKIKEELGKTGININFFENV